jgi:hypothetical protein
MTFLTTPKAATTIIQLKNTPLYNPMFLRSNVYIPYSPLISITSYP